jgi:hypothetical protein
MTLPSPRQAATLLRLKLIEERRLFREQIGRITQYKRELAHYAPEQQVALQTAADSLADSIVQIDDLIRELDNILR